VTVTGTRRALPAVTDLSAFRIIQEALTNTLRHAGPARAAVTVDYGTSAIRVEVTDTGRGLTDHAADAAYTAYVLGAPVPALVAAAGEPGAAPAGTVGHGLRGMRERAAAAGGTIEIGPGQAGGFRVAATLPIDDQWLAATADRATPTQKAGR
jgi:signal transduction histidine kinase